MIYTAIVYAMIDFCIGRLFDGIQDSTVVVEYDKMPDSDEIKAALRRYLLTQGSQKIANTDESILYLAMGTVRELESVGGWSINRAIFKYVYGIVNELIRHSFTAISRGG
jgi:Na+/phosphate symporter